VFAGGSKKGFLDMVALFSKELDAGGLGDAARRKGLLLAMPEGFIVRRSG